MKKLTFGSFFDLCLAILIILRQNIALRCESYINSVCTEKFGFEKSWIKKFYQVILYLYFKLWGLNLPGFRFISTRWSRTNHSGDLEIHESILSGLTIFLKAASQVPLKSASKSSGNSSVLLRPKKTESVSENNCYWTSRANLIIQTEILPRYRMR